jgi:aminoglycoside phosphotransferase (APT) family kinase protein
MDGLILLGQGREAEVFALPDGTVLKLMRDPGQLPAMDREADALATVTAKDGLVPALHRRVTIGDRPGIVLDRVRGPDLLSLIGSRPWLVPRAAHVLAAVHTRIHARIAPPGLPDLHAELERRIRTVPNLPAELASWTLSVLDRLPRGGRLCHGDLHLGNILGGLDSPVVIDWGEAARGDPLADVAHTWLLHRMGIPPPGTPRHVRAAAPLVGGVLARRYLAGYGRHRPFDDDLFRRWQIVRAAARLHAGINEEAGTLVRWLHHRRRTS